MPRSHVTIRDVAARAGVSHQTVSRVINGSARVLPHTRAKVEAAITALGYRPNAIARSMARGKTATLACIAPNLTDYTFASLINGAEIEAREHGFFLLSASAPDEETFAALIGELVSSRRSEGVMVINPYVDGRFAHLPPGFPTVFAGARPRADAVNSVCLDDVAVGQTATGHLLENGHRAVGCFTGPMVEDCAQDRYLGYTNALEQAGLTPDPAWTVEGDWLPESGYRALMGLHANDRLPGAIFAQNDQIAAGALRAAKELGISVPAELALIGVDDNPMAAYLSPPLTTMRQDFAAIGARAIQILLDEINDPHSANRQHIKLPAQLIVRQSCCRQSNPV